MAGPGTIVPTQIVLTATESLGVSRRDGVAEQCGRATGHVPVLMPPYCRANDRRVAVRGDQVRIPRLRMVLTPVRSAGFRRRHRKREQCW